jgi:hypothetical protein
LIAVERSPEQSGDCVVKKLHELVISNAIMLKNALLNLFEEVLEKQVMHSSKKETIDVTLVCHRPFSKQDLSEFF